VDAHFLGEKKCPGGEASRAPCGNATCSRAEPVLWGAPSGATKNCPFFWDVCKDSCRIALGIRFWGYLGDILVIFSGYL